MLRTVVLAAGLLGCRPAVTGLPPASGLCAPDRIGRVAIAGGTVEDVPQLAVLEGTLDDAARTERVRLAAIDVLHTRGYPRAYVAVARRQAAASGSTWRWCQVLGFASRRST
jgi:hypothetical protein